MTGVEMIAAERKRQMEREGWTAQHDDDHTLEQLNRAAQCYALHAEAADYPHVDEFQSVLRGVPPGWPWDEEWWKPSTDPIRDLVKAGALIAAEIDRLTRRAAAEHE